MNINKGKDLPEVSLRNFDQVPHQPAEHLPERPVGIRRKDFSEYVLGFSEDMAVREANRCLNCGCMGLSKCELRRLADRYEVDPHTVGTPVKPIYPIQEDHPFITIDPNKCIFCQRCASNCPYGAMELDAGGFDDLGLPQKLTIGMNEKCVSCGKCVDSCPTGALVKKCVPFPLEPQDLRQVRTVCGYCGCGCNLTLRVQGRTLVEIVSEPEYGPNFGNTCVKGRFGHGFVNHPERLTVPLVKQGAYFVETSWEKAIGRVASRLSQLKTDYGPHTLAGLSSAKCTNEENYLMQKLMRATIGTNNIDHCARL
jgi:formate dehydrogenase major subunit